MGDSFCLECIPGIFNHMKHNRKLNTHEHIGTMHIIKQLEEGFSVPFFKKQGIK